MEPAPTEANLELKKALRRANLLAAAAETSQNLTRILDIDQLLPKTVDIICDAYNFYYAGVFLIDEAGEFAVLRAGRGEPGRIMIENNHKLAVGGNSMIGAATALNEARISLDVDTEKVWYPNPVLPETRSEMALPLATGSRVIGAVTVQSTEEAAFTDEDVSSLQAMANQLAIAIQNARQQRELEETHAELLRAKTFEAIATATGDAIHWIGNKAEPVPGSVKRIRHDLQLLVAAMAELLKHPPAAGDLARQPLAQLILSEAAALQEQQPDITAEVGQLNRLAPQKLPQRLSVTSMLEDLQIIDDAAALIMRVKEDLIGPAREQAPRPVMVDDVLQDTISSLDLPAGLVSLEATGDLTLAIADPVQLHRVFGNLLKNAHEAMAGQPQPWVRVSLRPDKAGEMILVDISDNGAGIAEADLDKIWITFHTTKGIRRHPGLGLPACRLILEQLGGHISVTSRPGQGSTFTVSLPVYKGKETGTRDEPGQGSLLLIDDDDSWRRFAGRVLGGAGYTVTTAGAADVAAQNLAEYNLIVVDDIPANGDPVAVLQALKEAGAIAKTLLVSSNPRVERTKDRKLMGVHDLQPKPYTGAGLLGQVKTALSAIR